MRKMKTAAAYGLAAILAITAFGVAADPTPAPTTGTVTGIVRGQDGKPAANATVRLVEGAKGFRPDKPVKQTADEPAKGEKKAKKAKALSATTDTDGKFKVENVLPGQYRVTASVSGSRGTSNIAVKAGETADVSISLHAAGAK